MGNSACLAAHHIAPYCIAGEELWVLSDLKDRALGLIFTVREFNRADRLERV
jgi:hypothetical protein